MACRFPCRILALLPDNLDFDGSVGRALCPDYDASCAFFYNAEMGVAPVLSFLRLDPLADEFPLAPYRRDESILVCYADRYPDSCHRLWASYRTTLVDPRRRDSERGF